MKIAYLFTTFPKLSETFLQREIRAIRRYCPSVSLEIYSLWGGKSHWEGLSIKKFPKRRLFSLLWHLPYWMLKRPHVLGQILHARPGVHWIGETLLALSFALVHARSFKKNPPDIFHAPWASGPATAALLFKELLGIPFVMGAHAFDVFRYGGDPLLSSKLREASLVHTSTEATKKELLKRGVDKVIVIRRSLDRITPLPPLRQKRTPLHLLSIGRLVPKKGYLRQLALYHALKMEKISFIAHIGGEGPLAPLLKKQIKALALEREVTLLGALDYEEVKREYTWADLFLFTGCIAPNGDRDGLPNVIAEAMAAGVVVLTTPVGGTTEAVRQEETGFVLKSEEPKNWVQTVARLQTDHTLMEALRQRAHKWVEENFSGRRNAVTLIEQCSIGTLQNRKNKIFHRD